MTKKVFIDTETSGLDPLNDGLVLIQIMIDDEVFLINVEKGEDFSVVKDMLEIAKKNEQGFYKYRWTKPNADGYFQKIAFIKLFEPFGWVFGAGEYPEDIKYDIQAEVADYIAFRRLNERFRREFGLETLALDTIVRPPEK